MTERMSGTDALLWHMERPETLMHTLKTIVVDPAQRGEPLTLADLGTGIEAMIGRVPHLSQRVRGAPWFPGRPFWVTEPGFAVADHLDEVVAVPPGDRAALDEVHSRLASTPLDLERPLWAITLVHGLEGGRQAIVVRIHHAVVDGGAALNGLLMLTDTEPGEPLAPTDPPEPERVTDRELQRQVVQEAPALVRDLGPLLRDTIESSKRARAYRREHPELPPFAGAPRNFSNAVIDDSRVCVSTNLPLGGLKRIAKAADVTINGVYHALIAGALREELAERGEDLGPVMASFGIAADDGDPRRVSGNRVTPTTVRLCTETEDPLERLRETAW